MKLLEFVKNYTKNVDVIISIKSNEYYYVKDTAVKDIKLNDVVDLLNLSVFSIYTENSTLVIELA